MSHWRGPEFGGPWQWIPTVAEPKRMFNPLSGYWKSIISLSRSTQLTIIDFSSAKNPSQSVGITNALSKFLLHVNLNMPLKRRWCNKQISSRHISKRHQSQRKRSNNDGEIRKTYSRKSNTTCFDFPSYHTDGSNEVFVRRKVKLPFKEKNDFQKSH